ncbi:MAG: hypothetical protein K0S33_3447 [Bacteroidetes bacterium]|jgi:hypothetical protein|nr:hypothetical protein [Bacteroidota bacterium]
MKLLFTTFLLIVSYSVFAGWTDLNTGINDKLTGVVFWGSKGLLAGHKGLYFTSTGGSGAASWTRYSITGNSSDSLTYEHTKFNHARSENSNGYEKAFVCGEDTVNNRAVIMYIDMSNMSYSIVYTGPSGSTLNRIAFCSPDSRYFAVGNNGLIVRFNQSSATLVPSSLTQDLSAIHFSGNNYSIGTNGAFILGSNNSGNFTYNVASAPAAVFTDVLCGGAITGYGVGNSYYNWTGIVATNHTNYDFGPLDARCMVFSGSAQFVGTSHGIFKSISPYSFLELQPTSSSYSINNFWNGTTGLYACGDNGTLLTTNDQGGLTKPFAKLALQGGCVNMGVLIGGMTGTANTCQWLINGSPVNYSCSPTFSYTFPSAGQYTVQVNVSNGPGSYDTAQQVITIVDRPEINKPVSLSKDVLCNQESIVITVDSSQLDVFYFLRKFGSGTLSYGTSGNGNGGSISFNTDILSVAGNYYLVAKSTLAQCSRNFTDTISLLVEKTRAGLHVNKTNVTPGETVTCYEHCTDAQNYQWTFSPNASPGSGNLPELSTSFGSIGSTQVKLVCWSNHGCYDSLETSGPMVYTEPNPDDSCWTMVNNGTDLPWGGYYLSDINEMYPSSFGGYFICGHYNNEEAFASRMGDSARMRFPIGGYLMKYTDNGAAKWSTYTNQNIDVSLPYNRDRIASVEEDQARNIYITGISQGHFYDNTGDSINLTGTGISRQGFLIKLDSLGRTLWTLETGPQLLPHDLSVDDSGNVFMLTKILAGWTTGVPYMPMALNGVVLDTLRNALAAPFFNYALLKIDPTGRMQWSAGISLAQNNNVIALKTNTDQQNNIYLTGRYETMAHLHSAGSLSAYTSIPSQGTGNLVKFFLAKYNSSGMIQWTMRSLNGGNIVDMATDKTGNNYITGKNISPASSPYQVFESSDGSRDSINFGEYYLVKIGSDGLYKWACGAASSYYGAGHRITLHENEVSVLGRIAPQNQAIPHIAVLNGTTNDSIVLMQYLEDYFVADYDTSGALLRVRTNGVNTVLNVSLTLHISGLFRKGDYYYLSRNSSIYSGSYSNFGTTLGLTNGYDGMVTRFADGCGITLTPGNDMTSINQRNSIEDFFLYPNPNDGRFDIDPGTYISGGYEINVSNCLGQILYKGTAENKTSLNLRGLPAGMYIVNINAEGKWINKKIVIE